ncbi:MAG: Crp/Fnr family transcriptional regulator [Anaerolineae bacterium]
MPEPFPVLIDLMRALPYFRALDDEALSQLAAQAVLRTVEAGEILLLEGEPAAGLWMIVEGRAKVYKLNPDGVELVLRIFGEGNTFNDISALDGGPNPANAAALSALTAWVLPAEPLQRLIRSHHRVAEAVVHALASRVRGLIRTVEDLSMYSVNVRLARFLIQQAQDPSLSGPGVTRTTIAAHLATTPQTISVALRELEATGAIEFDRHRIVILDESLLRSIAQLD